MPGLILKLRANEEILVNGVLMQNGDRNARLTVMTRGARILRLRDAIGPEEATTPVRRACYAAQLAVAGDLAVEDAVAGLGAAIDGIPGRLAAVAGADLAGARAALAGRDFYAAWRSLRRLIAVEDALPGDSPRAGAG